MCVGVWETELSNEMCRVRVTGLSHKSSLNLLFDISQVNSPGISIHVCVSEAHHEVYEVGLVTKIHNSLLCLYDDAP